jgi:hypothetical protein
MWVYEVLQFSPKNKGRETGLNLNRHLFNILTNSGVEYINMGNTHAPSIAEITIPGLLLADE